MSYGSVDGVLAYTRHLIEAGTTYSTTTRPTLAEVETFLAQRSAILDGCLAANGYVVPVPVSATSARLVLDMYANMGAAGDAELSMRSAGSNGEDENARENKFLMTFDQGCAYIASGAFAALGAPSAGASKAISGLYVGGRTRTGQPLRPIFGRTALANDPTRNSPVGEPGWNEE